MIHLGLQSINLLKLRSTIRQEGVWMFLGVSGPWLSAWLFTSADLVARKGFTNAQRHAVRAARLLITPVWWCGHTVEWVCVVELGIHRVCVRVR